MDWKAISQTVPVSLEVLKYKCFSFMRPCFLVSKWNKAQEFILIQNIRQLYPEVYSRTQDNAFTEMDWSRISFEVNKSTIRPMDFKNSKKCRERWLNHLAPFVNK